MAPDEDCFCNDEGVLGALRPGVAPRDLPGVPYRNDEDEVLAGDRPDDILGGGGRGLELILSMLSRRHGRYGGCVGVHLVAKVQL